MKYNKIKFITFKQKYILIYFYIFFSYLFNMSKNI